MHHTDSHIEDLIDFLDNSPVNFLAAAQVAARLDNAGFIRLEPTEEWTVEKGGKYYIVKNSSAVFAFIVGHGHPSAGYHIISAHSDSPCFRIKPHAEILCPGGAVKLNVEVYGGPILYTWFDRPLSVAGRVIVKSASPLHPETRLIHWSFCGLPRKVPAVDSFSILCMFANKLVSYRGNLDMTL